MKLWMIGCGNMAGAMLRRWIDSGVVKAGDVHVANRQDRALPDGVHQARALPTDHVANVVVLGVKPQQLADVADQYRAAIADVPVLVSMLAGTDAAALAAAFPGPEPVVTMPNLPVAIGKGVVAIHAPTVSPGTRATIDTLMAPLGLVRWLDDAGGFGAAGALSGCGPAFLFRFVDALATAGVSAGLAEADATALALATVEGAAAMAAEADRSPAALADAVASPGGMTRQGLNVLDEDAALADLMTRTLAAAIARGREMAAGK